MMEFVLFLYVAAIFGAALLLRPTWRQWHLPIALPLSLFISLETLLCILSLLHITSSHASPEKALVYEFLIQRLRSLIPLLWFWLTYECIRGEKLAVRYVLLLLLLPLVVIPLRTLHAVGLWSWSASGPPQWFTILIGVGFTYAYGLVLGSILWLAWHIYHVTHSTLKTVATSLLSLFPLALYLHEQRVMPYRIGAPATLLVLTPVVLYLRWLIIVPVARERLADYLTDGVVVLDTHDRVVDANPAAAGLLAQLAGTSAPLPCPSPLPEPLRAAFDLSQPRQQQREMDFSALQHPIRYAETVLLPLEGRKQRRIGHLLLLRDVSRRRRAEQERERHITDLQAAHQQLQQLDELKTAFFANISHEFRTPLTLSLGPLDDLLAGLHGALPAAAYQPLQQIRRHNQRLLRLINQLLEFSRLEAGFAPTAWQPINLVDYLPRVLAVFQAAAVRGGIALRWTPLVPGAWVHSEYDALDKILANLLSNALKYTSAGGEIEVRLEAAAEGNWQMEVRDTGCGIDPAFLPQVFERFSQQTPNGAQAVGALPMSSIGIGLALVKQLVMHHGGQISVSSVLGQGSCFTVLLPAVPAPETPVASPPAEPVTPLVGYWDEMDRSPTLNRSAPPPTDLLETDRQPLVLLVDDHPELCDYIAFHLTDRHQILTASNGLEGLQLAERYSPDLVISDVMMPVMDGYQLCQRLKSQWATSHIPVILLTARAGQADKLAGLESQADDYLSKPFNRHELQARVANLLMQRLQLRDYYSRLFTAAPTVFSSSSHRLDERFVQHVRQVITQSLSDCDLQTQDIATALQVTERQLQRKLKALIGQSPQQLILEQRLQQASQLLVTTDLSITDISQRSGFASLSYFTRKFKSAFQQTPSEYRETKPTAGQGG